MAQDSVLSPGEFSEIIQQSIDCLLVLDDEGQICFATPSAGEWLGHEPDTLGGMNLAELLPEMTKNEFRKALRECRCERRSVNFTCWDDGEKPAHHCHLDPLGEYILLIGNPVPVSGEERVQELGPGELLESVQDAVVATTAEGRVVYWNGGAEKLFGRSTEEAIGRQLGDELPEEAQRELQTWSARIIQGENYLGDWRAWRRDGSPLWVEVSVSRVLDEEGRVRFLMAIARDITSRREMEDELVRLNEKLEQIVAERTEIAEKRTRQLQALTIQLTMTEQRERRRLAQFLHDDLQQLVVAGRMKITRLRKKLKSETPRHELEQLDNYLIETIQQCRKLTSELNPPVLEEGGLGVALEGLARQKEERYELEVEVKTEPGAEPESRELATLLFQCTRELLFNIVKHADTKRAWITLTRVEPDQLRLEVRDEGKGFVPPNFSDPTALPGFGLFSVSSRLETYGARMKVESAPGQGTRVEITAPAICLVRYPVSLPLQSDEEVQAFGVLNDLLHPEAISEASAAKIRVMLADDHRLVRECIAGMLSDESDMLVIGEADDGLSAVELCRQHHPDVVLMDISMPRMNGIEATRLILKEFPDTCIIALSMHQHEDMARAMREAGAIDYFSKSETGPELCQVIRARFREKSAPWKNQQSG